MKNPLQNVETCCVAVRSVFMSLRIMQGMFISVIGRFRFFRIMTLRSITVTNVLTNIFCNNL